MPKKCLNVDNNPPYILDLAPSNSFLFLNLKRWLKKRKCLDVIAKSAEQRPNMRIYLFTKLEKKSAILKLQCQYVEVHVCFMYLGASFVHTAENFSVLSHNRVDISSHHPLHNSLLCTLSY